MHKLASSVRVALTIVAACLFGFVSTGCTVSDPDVSTASEPNAQAVTDSAVAVLDDPAAGPADDIVMDTALGAIDDLQVRDAIAELLSSGLPSAAKDFDATCYANAMVTSLGGAAGIEERYGLSAADFRDGQTIGAYELDQPTAEQLADATWPCADYLGLLFAWDSAFMAQADCLAKYLPADLAKQWITASYMADQGASLNLAPEDQMAARAVTGAEACGIE